MRNSIEKVVCQWKRRGYPAGLPDEAPVRLEQLNKVLSYKMIVRAILKNDLKSIGIVKPKCEAYNKLKQIELNERLRKNERAD